MYDEINKDNIRTLKMLQIYILSLCMLVMTQIIMRFQQQRKQIITVHR
jgi:hypothetical protein